MIRAFCARFCHIPSNPKEFLYLFIFISKVFWKTSNANYLAVSTRNLDFIYNWRAISENLIFILNYSWRSLVYQKALPHIIINTDFLKVSDILVFNWNIKCQLELVCVHYDLSVESAWNKNTPFKPHFAWKINTWRKYDIIWNSFGCDIFRLYFIWDIFILHFILFRVICKIHVATIKRNIQSFVRRFLSFLELHFVWKMNVDYDENMILRKRFLAVIFLDFISSETSYYLILFCLLSVKFRLAELVLLYVFSTIYLDPSESRRKLYLWMLTSVIYCITLVLSRKLKNNFYT